MLFKYLSLFLCFNFSLLSMQEEQEDIYEICPKCKHTCHEDDECEHTKIVSKKKYHRENNLCERWYEVDYNDYKYETYYETYTVRTDEIIGYRLPPRRAYGFVNHKNAWFDLPEIIIEEDEAFKSQRVKVECWYPGISYNLSPEDVEFGGRIEFTVALSKTSYGPDEIKYEMAWFDIPKSKKETIYKTEKISNKRQRKLYAVWPKKPEIRRDCYCKICKCDNCKIRREQEQKIRREEYEDYKERYCHVPFAYDLGKRPWKKIKDKHGQEIFVEHELYKCSKK